MYNVYVHNWKFNDLRIVFVIFQLNMKPFFVTVDHKKKCVIVTIRGSLSEADAITDIIAIPTDIPGYHDINFKAHKVKFVILSFHLNYSFRGGVILYYYQSYGYC